MGQLVPGTSLLSSGDRWRRGLGGLERGSLGVEPIMDVVIVLDGSGCSSCGGQRFLGM